MRDQFIAETRGNPLALLELPRGLTAAQLAGGFGLPGALAGRVEQSFRRRVEALPGPARRAAEVAVVFGDWPSRGTGPLAFVPRGLLGFLPGPSGPNEKYHLRGLQVIGWNLYVIAGLVMLAAAVAAAARAAARGRRVGLSSVPVLPDPDR